MNARAKGGLIVVARVKSIHRRLYQKGGLVAILSITSIDRARQAGRLTLREDIALVVISPRPFEDVPGIPNRAVCLSKPFGAGDLLDAIARASGINKSAA